MSLPLKLALLAGGWGLAVVMYAVLTMLGDDDLPPDGGPT